MVFAFLLDVALYTTAWTIKTLYNGTHYMIYGSQQDPILLKLENLEKKLFTFDKNNENYQYYWNTRSKYTHDHWVAISSNKLILQSPNKNITLKAITDYLDSNPTHKCLLVHVGDEQSMLEL